MVIIDSCNGLSPVQRQAITWTNAGLLSIGFTITNFFEICIDIQENCIWKYPLENTDCFCSGLVLKQTSWHYNDVINERDGASNHQPHDCLLSRLFRRRSKKTSKLRVTGLCAGNSPVTGEFPAQMASNAETVPFDDVIMKRREMMWRWKCTDGLKRLSFMSPAKSHSCGYHYITNRH